MATSIVSLAEALSYLGESSTVAESTLDLIALIKRLAERAVRSWVGCGITQATYTHYLPDAALCAGKPHLGEILRLPEWPVRSITNLYEDTYAYSGQGTGAFDSSTELTAGTHYFLSLDQSGLSWFGHIVRLGAHWPAVGGSVKAVYTAGWSAAELDGDVSDLRLDASDIKLATLKAIAEAYVDAQHEGQAIKSERLDDWAVTYANESGPKVELPRDAKLLLNRFRREAVG